MENHKPTGGYHLGRPKNSAQNTFCAFRSAVCATIERITLIVKRDFLGAESLSPSERIVKDVFTAVGAGALGFAALFIITGIARALQAPGPY